jgi:hypothetical protein
VTVTVTVAVCVNDPLFPIIVTVYVPLDPAESVSTEVAFDPEVRLTLDGLREAVNPDEGETEEDSDTVPVNPFILETVSVEVADAPAAKLMEDGFAERLKVGLGGGVLPVIVKLSVYVCPPVLMNLLWRVELVMVNNE